MKQRNVLAQRYGEDDHVVFFSDFTSSTAMASIHLLIYLDKYQLPIASMAIYVAVGSRDRGKTLKI